MLRRDVWNRVGGHSEKFTATGSDVELGLKVHGLGLRVLYTPHTGLTYRGGAAQPLLESDFWACLEALRPWLERGDPFYNPNLSLSRTDCALRTEPRTVTELAAEALARVSANQVTPVEPVEPLDVPAPVASRTAATLRAH